MLRGETFEEEDMYLRFEEEYDDIEEDEDEEEKANQQVT